MEKYNKVYILSEQEYQDLCNAKNNAESMINARDGAIKKLQTILQRRADVFRTVKTTQQKRIEKLEHELIDLQNQLNTHAKIVPFSEVKTATYTDTAMYTDDESAQIRRAILINQASKYTFLQENIIDVYETFRKNLLNYPMYLPILFDISHSKFIDLQRESVLEKHPRKLIAISVLKSVDDLHTLYVSLKAEPKVAKHVAP